MRKLFSASPLAGLTIVLSVCITSLFIINACRKMDHSKEDRSDESVINKFFLLKPETDPTVAAIAASIKRQNMKRNFVTKLVKKAGFAIWDKAKIMTKDPEDGKQVFIPLALEDKKQTKAILIVKLRGNDTLYHLLYGSQARQYGFDSTSKGWNAKDIFHAFILFDYEIFGHKRFNVTESRLVDRREPGNAVEITKIFTPGIGNKLQTFYPVTVWTTYVICGSCGQQQREANTNRSKLCCNAQYVDMMVTYWFDDSDGSFGWYTPEGYESGGGAPCPGCNWEDTNPCELDEQGHATGFCNEDWEPDNAGEAPFNPNVYDSIEVSNNKYFHDSFPCTYALLKDTILDPNFIAQWTLLKAFNIAQFSHLTFKMSTTMNADSATAVTTRGRREIDNLDQYHFYDTIILNPYYMEHMTKEAKIATILHETVHAYIKFVFDQYKAHEIDSFQVKELFPVHWNHFKQYVITPTQEHKIMMDKYIQEMAAMVRSHWNTAATTSQKNIGSEALAWGGVFTLAGWAGLSDNLYITDTCKIKAINGAGERANLSLTSSITPAGCGTFILPYTDSLKMTAPCK